MDRCGGHTPHREGGSKDGLRQASETGERDPGGGLETGRGKSFKGKKLAASDATDGQGEMKHGPTGETWKLPV